MLTFASTKLNCGKVNYDLVLRLTIIMFVDDIVGSTVIYLALSHNKTATKTMYLCSLSRLERPQHTGLLCDNLLLHSGKFVKAA